MAQGTTLVDGDLAVGVELRDIVAWDLATGAERWRRRVPEGPVQLLALPSGILVKHDGLQLLARNDGALLAEVSPGWVGPNDPAVGVDPVVVRDRGDLRTLHALAPTDLSVRWAAEVAEAESLGAILVALEGGRIAAQADRPGAGSDLVVFDPDGRLEGRTPLPDGALIGQHAGRLVHAGADGRLRTLDQSGTVHTVTEPVPGVLPDVEAGVALAQADDALVAVDVVTGQTRWRAEGWPPPAWIPEHNLLLRSSDALVLEAADATTGNPEWRIDSTGGQPVGGCTPDRLLAQPAAVMAIGSTDGCVAWWHPLSTAPELTARP
ncbi:MAG TPA: hypothetical protein VM287_06480 [Egibacteraceae bacterium]|nr:hypothetical protein [Egibacteraceae bacterium]